MKRRSFLKGTIAASAATGAALVAPSAIAKWSKEAFEAEKADAVLAAIGADKAEDSDKIKIKAPEIAENGNTVPVTVDAPGAVSIALIAEGNPEPLAATMNFGPLAAAQNTSLRIRLAGSQNVTAVAKMADGSFAKATTSIKVTIGGCGG